MKGRVPLGTAVRTARTCCVPDAWATLPRLDCWDSGLQIVARGGRLVLVRLSPQDPRGCCRGRAVLVKSSAEGTVLSRVGSDPQDGVDVEG